MKKPLNLRNNKGMATWLKFVLIAGALSVLGFIGLIIAGGMFYTQMTSPDKIKQVSRKIMVIRDPLPAGFKYVTGTDLVTPFVVFMNADQKTMVTFFVAPSMKKEGTSITPEGAIDHVFEGQSLSATPGPSGALPAKKLINPKKGILEVGGLKMPYVIGHAAKAADTSDVANTFFGGVKSPATGKLTFIMAQSADLSANAQPLTIEKIKGLTDAIEKFN